MSPYTAANAIDAAALAEELARFRIVDPGRLTALLAEFPGGTGGALAEFLVWKGALSPFQAERALAGGARWLNLGPYRLVGEANPGTFGPVYAAAHRDKPGQFRLRMFPLRSLWRARQAKQLARTLAAAAHPAVVPLADADSANGFHYLVWPHVAGQPLNDRIATVGPLSPAEVTALLARLAEALFACHGRNVAHGTITPQAVVLEPDGQPRLLEHGAGAILAENLAADESLFDTLSATVATAGVLEYAAPECVTGPGAPTAPADQYALGAVAYFALTGRSPFATGSRAEQLAAKVAGPPRSVREMNPAVTPELAAVIDRMLRPTPAERFRDLNEVRDWLTGAARTKGEASPSVATVGDVPQRTPLPPTPPASMAQPDTPSLASLETRRSIPQLPGPVAPSPSRPASPSPALPSPTSPAPRTPSPVPTDDPAMAKILLSDPFAAGNAPPLPPPPAKPNKPSDPRRTVGTPVHYHTEPPDSATGSRLNLTIEPPEPGEPPVTDSTLWKKVKQNLMFWRMPSEVVLVSVFGPPSVTPGQQTKVSVFLHPPETADSVHTLCRAFHHDAVLIGTGYLAREVTREEEVAVHFSVANAGVSKTLQTFSWRGQPHRMVFDLHVPWEAPAGPAPGVISVGIDNVRIGKIEFRLVLLARKG